MFIMGVGQAPEASVSTSSNKNHTYLIQNRLLVNIYMRKQTAQKRAGTTNNNLHNHNTSVLHNLTTHLHH